MLTSPRIDLIRSFWADQMTTDDATQRLHLSIAAF
jgi:hypothetical protein